MMKRCHTWGGVALLAGFVLLAGCASGLETSDGSAIELGRKVVKNSMPLEGMVVRALLEPPAPRDRGSFWTDRQVICMAAGRTVSEAHRTFNALCTSKGAVYERGFCRRSRDSDDVMFMAKFESHDLPRCRTLLVAEPKPGAGASEYLKFLVEQGYVTAARRREEARAAEEREAAAEAKEARAQQAEQMRKRAETARLALELPFMKKRGTRVCKNEGNHVFTGFVEDFTDEKLKVLVTGGYLAGARDSRIEVPTGTIHWDAYVAWRLC